MFLGLAPFPRPLKHLAQVATLVGLFTVEPIYPALPVFAEAKAALRRQGAMIDDFDLLIGATAVKGGMTLVTENVKHLSHVPGVNIENWIERQ